MRKPTYHYILNAVVQKVSLTQPIVGLMWESSQANQ